MDNCEHKVICEKLDILQKTLDRFYEDFRDDRRARGDMEITLKNVANKTDMTREDLSDHAKETKRAVEDGIREVVGPMESKLSKLTESKNTVIHYINDQRKKSFASRLMFWR